MHMAMCIASRIEKNLIWKTTQTVCRLGSLLKNQSTVKGGKMNLIIAISLVLSQVIAILIAMA